jgi:hypothetical protein
MVVMQTLCNRLREERKPLDAKRKHLAAARTGTLSTTGRERMQKTYFTNDKSAKCQSDVAADITSIPQDVAESGVCPAQNASRGISASIDRL